LRLASCSVAALAGLCLRTAFERTGAPRELRLGIDAPAGRVTKGGARLKSYVMVGRWGATHEIVKIAIGVDRRAAKPSAWAVDAIEATAFERC
jgi:hypothetical protein